MAIGYDCDISFNPEKTTVKKLVKVHQVTTMNDLVNAVEYEISKKGLKNEKVVLVNRKGFFDTFPNNCKESDIKDFVFDDTYRYFKNQMYTTEVGNVLGDFNIFRINYNGDEIEVFYKII